MFFPGAAWLKLRTEDGRARMCLLQSLAGRATAAFRSVLDDLVTTAFPSDCRVCSGPLLRFTILPSARTAGLLYRRKLWPCAHMWRGSRHRHGERSLRQPVHGRGPAVRRLPQSSAEVRARRCVRGLPERTARDDSPAQVRADERRRQAAWPMLAEAILSIESVAAQDLIVVPVPLFPASCASGATTVRAACQDRSGRSATDSSRLAA